MTGLCECGCGRETTISPKNVRRYGYVRGKPRRFIRGHSARVQERTPDYREEDRGFATPCWVWIKVCNERGYGRVVSKMAHRVYFERHVAPVPAGLELDHLCRVRECVNPEHLEPVTHKENMRRGYAVVQGAAPDGFPSELRSARLGACLSQDDLGRASGVSQSAIARWEAGKGLPQPEHLEALQRVVEIDPMAAEQREPHVRSAA
jgi:DNA-binding transcriptional regulator YiaG